MDAIRDASSINGTSNVQDVSSTYSSIVKLAKAVKELQTQDLSYHLTAEAEVSGVQIETLQQRLLALTNQLLSKLGLPETQLYANASQVMDRFEPVVEVLDNLYERVDTGLTLAAEAQRAGNKPSEAANVLLARVGHEPVSMVVARNLNRPQAQFAEKVDNGYTTPYVSLVYQLGKKPNAMKPISQEHLDKFQGVKLVDVTLEMAAGLPYPYQFEQDHLVYPESLFQHSEPIPLRRCRSEVAVDLEHHDYRSYQGFVCLMQISTRRTDYIVDTLSLRRELFILNEVFTDPTIIKVFHGAESDILWLQRDFSLYVVNLFDTYHASHSLALGKHSLAYLMHRYAGVVANKELQMADWRVRPLPQPMVEYARSDTHYLLFIFDVMRNELVRASNPETFNLLHATLDKSQSTATQRFAKVPYDAATGLGPGGWASTLEKCHLPLTPRQVAVFRQLHAWRDMRARDEDESVRFILPNHMLFSLAFKMPTTTAGVLGCCDPVPIAVRMGAPDLAALIADVDLEMGCISAPSRRSLPNHLTSNEAAGAKPFDEESKLANIPVAASLLGKPFQDLTFPTPSIENAAPVSVLFGVGFLDQNPDALSPEKKLRLALRDQVLTTLDFCPLPPTVVIEVSCPRRLLKLQAQVEDARIAKGDQVVSSTAAPEGHEFVAVAKPKPPVPKGAALVPSGKSTHLPQKVDDIIASALKRSPEPVVPLPLASSAPISEYDYSNSSALVASLTSVTSRRPRAKGNEPKGEHPDQPPVYDPFGDELEVNSLALKGAQSRKSDRGGASGFHHNRSQTFRP
ncbi:exosome nuclease subunit [Massospora cicadina]|nr:exosome nuclease subunit [Massospora cicadina]